MTTALENIIHVIFVAVKNDSISKNEMLGVLRELTGAVNGGDTPAEGYLAKAYETGEECLAVLTLNDKITQRFEHCFRIYYGKDE